MPELPVAVEKESPHQPGLLPHAGVFLLSARDNCYLNSRKKLTTMNSTPGFPLAANWGTASLLQTCHPSGYTQMKGCRNGSFQHTWLRRSLIPNGGNDAKIYTGWKFWCMSPQSQFIFIPEGINNRKAGFLLTDLLFIFFRSFVVAPFISPSDFSFCCGFILILVSSNTTHIN